MPAKYWEIIASQIAAAGWSYGYASYSLEDGRKMWAIDASRDGHKIVIRADNILAGFLELKSQTKAVERDA